MTTLVLKDHYVLNHLFGISLSWRIPCKDGTHYDLEWGNTRDDSSLRRLVHDPKWREHMPTAVIDERVETRGDEPLQLPDWWDVPVHEERTEQPE